MSRSWERRRGAWVHYVHVDDHQVVVGSHAGSGHTDNATTASHAEFLAGRHAELVRGEHGDAVLAEIRATVTGTAAAWPGSPRQLQEQRRLDFLASLPEAPDLAVMATAEGTVDGGSAYGNDGGCRTRVASDSRTLVIDQGVGELLDSDGRPIADIRLEGGSSAVVDLEDHFFVEHFDNVAVIGPDGAVLWDSYEGVGDHIIFGSQLRITGLYRHGRTVFARYRWFSGEHPPGLLELGPRGGFVGVAIGRRDDPDTGAG